MAAASNTAANGNSVIGNFFICFLSPLFPGGEELLMVRVYTYRIGLSRGKINIF